MRRNQEDEEPGSGTMSVVANLTELPFLGKGKLLKQNKETVTQVFDVKIKFLV